MRDQAMAAFRANDVLFRYIIDSLRHGGVAERPFKPATSKFFWDEGLSRLKAKESCCESRRILADRAAERTGCLKRQSDKERKTAL